MSIVNAAPKSLSGHRPFQRTGAISDYDFQLGSVVIMFAAALPVSVAARRPQSGAQSLSLVPMLMYVALDETQR
jgi:hypothetical protein